MRLATLDLPVCPAKHRNRSGPQGWKVNGAGGEGGSLTILCGPQSHAKRAMIREIEEESPLLQNIPIYLGRFGLRIWDTRQGHGDTELT